MILSCTLWSLFYYLTHQQIMITVIYDEQLCRNVFIFATNVFDIIEFSMEALRERVLETFNFDILTILN